MGNELYEKVEKVLLRRLEEVSDWNVKEFNISIEIYYTLSAIKLLKELYEE